MTPRVYYPQVRGTEDAMLLSGFQTLSKFGFIIHIWLPLLPKLLPATVGELQKTSEAQSQPCIPTSKIPSSRKQLKPDFPQSPDTTATLWDCLVHSVPMHLPLLQHC